MLTTPMSIINWLKENVIYFQEDYLSLEKINNKFLVNYNNHVSLKDCDKIDVQFGKIYGDFNILNNSAIDSLKGAPIEVEGSVNIQNCYKLENLQHGPKFIGGKYTVYNCSLKSLVGSPTSIRDMDVSNNELKSLYGSPKIVLNDFNASYNKLKTNYGMPVKLNGLLNLSNNYDLVFDISYADINKINLSDTFYESISKNKNYKEFISILLNYELNHNIKNLNIKNNNKKI